jgi:ketosteroid isomerase-like protein
MRKAKAWAIVLSVLLLDAAGTGSPVLPAVPRAAGANQPNALRDLIVSKERQELDALKGGDRKTFADLISDDAVFVDPRGPATKDEVVKSTAELKLHEYSMEDVRFLPISGTAGLICYKLTEKATSHGRDMAGQVYVSATWTKRNDQWVCIFSQETPVK